MGEIPCEGLGNMVDSPKMVSECKALQSLAWHARWEHPRRTF